LTLAEQQAADSSSSPYSFMEQARVRSLRQTALLTFLALIALQTVSCTVCVHFGGTTVAEGLLFATYTATTAGFGSVPIPETPGFFVFACANMLVGVCMVTVVVSQGFQFIALQTANTKRSNDQLELAERGIDLIAQQSPSRARDLQADQAMNLLRLYKMERENRHLHNTNTLLKCLDFLKRMVRGSEKHRAYVVAGYLVFLLLVGTFGMMGLEGMTFLQGLYFASYAMTTIG